MMAYQCAFESMRHPRSNYGSHVKIQSTPVIFKRFEKKVYAFYTYIACILLMQIDEDLLENSPLGVRSTNVRIGYAFTAG